MNDSTARPKEHLERFMVEAFWNWLSEMMSYPSSNHENRSGSHNAEDMHLIDQAKKGLGNKETQPLLRYLPPLNQQGEKRYDALYDSHGSYSFLDPESFRLQQQREQEQFARSRCTLTVCMGLLIAAILCGPLILYPNDYSMRWWDVEPDDCRLFQRETNAQGWSRLRFLLQRRKCRRYNRNQKQQQPQDSQNPAVSLSGSNNNPNFHPNQLHVLSSHSSFPSYSEFGGKPYSVTFDNLSIRFNDQPVVLLGGSIHPSRMSSRHEWERALDEAVRHGLNLITVYVFWSAHRPFFDMEIDWSLPYSRVLLPLDAEHWEWSEALQACANRGLFVHLRLGPYACGEYSYGGIPEWVGVQYPNVRMRRMDSDWLHVMEEYVTSFTKYITSHSLWAHQGGPIALAQIENELGRLDENVGFMEDMVEDGIADDVSSRLGDEVQNYADWCGELVQRVAPAPIVWTMCNGLTANNTIATYDGNDGVSYLENHGDSGRIQIDQPAMWTELEQGFQTWGEQPQNPREYFWGVTARDVAKQVLRWVARGGWHVNYYMWFGGYNRGRTAGTGVINAYATEGIMCPSGERRQPKFGHLQALHHVVASVAPVLVQTTAIPSPREVEILNGTSSEWTVGSDQLAFFYLAEQTEVIFLENNCEENVVARVPSKFSVGLTGLGGWQNYMGYDGHESDDNHFVIPLKPWSVVVLVDGEIAFGSATIGPEASAYARNTLTNFVSLLDWDSWREPAISMSTTPECQSPEHLANHPIEQTQLLQPKTGSCRWSDYAWYATSFTLDENTSTSSKTKLFIETAKANAMLLFVDGKYMGSTENHERKDDRITFDIPIVEDLSAGPHELTVLSESIGYHNLVGRWGGSVGPKPKGIAGDVILAVNGKNQSLVNETSQWCSLAGLKGETMGMPTSQKNSYRDHVWDQLDDAPKDRDGPLWMIAYFDTPQYGADQHLFLELTEGRGHVWLNGYDLGRFWSITRDPENETVHEHSERYYHLPQEWLRRGGTLNELVLFNVLGKNLHDGSAKLVLSWIDTATHSSFNDEIGFADSCLV